MDIAGTVKFCRSTMLTLSQSDGSQSIAFLTAAAFRWMMDAEEAMEIMRTTVSVVYQNASR